MRQGLMGMCLLLVTVVAAAQGPRAVREQVEASMLVTGTIDVEPDGSVSGHALDSVEKLPAGVVGLLARHIPDWRFEPVIVDGQARRARAPASIRIVARKLNEDEYSLRIAGAHFDAALRDAAHARPSTAARTDRKPPRYPAELLRAGAGGTVYLLLKIGPDGAVQDQIAEQVNLRAIAPERQMSQMREQFARATFAASREWTFSRPADVEADATGSWVARVPVDFHASRRPPPGYGEWEAYVPGPRQANPWSNGDDGISPDTLALNGTYPVGQAGPKLLTPLQSPQG